MKKRPLMSEQDRRGVSNELTGEYVGRLSKMINARTVWTKGGENLAEFEKFYSVVSHCVLGFVIATTLMILPSFATEWYNILIYIGCIIAGGIASFLFSKLCNKIKPE